MAELNGTTDSGDAGLAVSVTHANGDDTVVHAEVNIEQKSSSCCDDDLSSPTADSEYFQSYEDLQCHQGMVFDRVRTSAYRKSIHKCLEQYSPSTAVVLEVGCGTGILSAFAAQSNPKKVFAVEASPKLAEISKEVMRSNKLDSIVDVICARVEDASISEPVDVLISEWMGYGLLTEWMLGSVLIARDRWLKPGGLMIPAKARLYMAPIAETCWLRSRKEQWMEATSLYGIDMGCVIEKENESIFGKMVVQEVMPWEIIARSVKILEFDLSKIQIDELNRLEVPFEFTMYGADRCHGFCTWFDLDLPGDVRLTTSPFTDEETTHWAQLALYLPQPISVKQDTRLAGRISFDKHVKNKHYLTANVTYKVDDSVEFSHFFEDLLDA